MSDRSAWREILSDVSAVTVTPFVDGRLDIDGLRRNLEHVVGGGIRLVVAAGNTGEFYALEPDELVAATRAHVETAAGRARVLAGIGYRPAEAIRLGRACLDAGADGLLVHFPVHPYVGEAGLLAYYEAIAQTTDAPLVLYARGPQLSPAVARRLTAVGPVVGVKYAVPDPRAFAAAARAAPELGWVCGLAEGWAPFFWPGGARGFTSGLANVRPSLALALLDGLRAADAALSLELWAAVRPFEELRARHGDANNVAVVKAALDLLGLAGGELRPPLAALSSSDRAELATILEAWKELP